MMPPRIGHRLAATDRVTAAVWLLVALGFALRLAGIRWGLPFAFEEATPLRKAWEMWHWESPAGLDPNPHFFRYPSLMLYLHLLIQGLLYLGMKLSGSIASPAEFSAQYLLQPAPFFLAGRALAAAFGAATILATYKLGEALAGRRVALLGAALLAVSPLHVTRSQMIEVDVPLTLFAMLGLLACVRLGARPSLRGSILAGALIGLAASVKYPGALLLLALVATLLALLPSLGPRRAAGYFGGALLAAGLAFALTSPFVLLDHQAALEDIGNEQQHISMGHFGDAGVSSWRFYADALRGGLLGWPALALLALGALGALIPRPRWRALPLAAFALPYAATLLAAGLHAERYLLPLWPLFLLLIAYAAFALPRRLVAPRWRHLAQLAAGALLLAALLPLPHALARLHRTMGQDTRLLASRWVAANVPSGSFIVSEQYGPEIYAPQLKLHYPPETARAIDRLMSGKPYFGLLLLPLFQVMPERTGVFYDLALYRNADYLITSGSVRSRYEQESARFAQQLAFYRQLEQEYVLAERFTPSGGGGPELRIYRNRAQSLPLEQRGALLPLSPVRVEGGAATGSEELFYLEQGVLLETLKHPEAALESYRLALRYPFRRASSLQAVVLRAADCLLAAGRRDEAAAFLDDMIRRTATPELRERFRAARATISVPIGGTREQSAPSGG